MKTDTSSAIEAEMSPIIVTGAAGRIGRSLLRNLSARGVPARAVSRTSAPREMLPGVTWVESDLTRPDSLAPALAGGKRMFLLTSADERLVES